MRTQTFPQQLRAPGMVPHLANGAAAPAAPQVPAIHEHTDVIHDTQFDYYGLQLATASSDRTIGIHVARAGAPLNRVATLTGHEGPVWMVSWAHPRFGNLLASASYDQKAIIWKEIHQGAPKWTPVHVIDIHQGSVNAVQWAPEEYGPVVATASSDGTVAITTYRDGCWQPSVKLSNNSNQIAHAMGATSVTFAPFKSELVDHVVVASGGCDGHVRLWVSASSPERGLGFELHQVIEAHADWVRDVAFCPTSPASRFVILASCGQDKTVVMYRKPWDQLCAEISEGASQATEWERSVIEFAEPVWRLSWAPSGEMLVVTNSKSEVFVLREGVDFTEPWIKLPLKDFQQ
ncbi:WD domain, G-beta repeat family protein [Leishmania donovani]|uniref:WD domain, G-beta repeat family protein n=2 Tax=Leishmania donovani TaxID=5661 RepID=A0A504X5T7_LEIDO|nr:WD domain, G-beta repeat family protein [Leishmania donovani]